MGENTRKIVARTGAVMLCVALLLIVIFNSFEAVCFRLSRYEKAFVQYETAQRIGTTQEELMQVTEEMLKYLLGQREALDMEANIHGVQQRVFGEREVQHMVDVKQLFQNGLLLRKIAYGVFALGFFLLAWGNRTNAMRTMADTWFWVLAVLGTCIGGIALCFVIDFQGAFIKFHEICFQNDLWLLDPNTEVLMMMFDNDFFMQCVYSIAWRVLGGAALMSALCVGLKIALKKPKNTEAKAA